MSPPDEPADQPAPGRGTPTLGRSTQISAQDGDNWLEAPLTGREGDRSPLFIGREMYRHRRIMDAARLLPVFGTALLLLPILLVPTHRTASTAVYIFLVWFFLILTAAFLAHRLSAPLRQGERRERMDGGEG